MDSDSNQKQQQSSPSGLLDISLQPDGAADELKCQKSQHSPCYRSSVVASTPTGSTAAPVAAKLTPPPTAATFTAGRALPTTAAASTTRSAAVPRDDCCYDDFAAYMTSVAARELEESPGAVKQHMWDLKVLRGLQIVCTCAFIVMSVLVLSSLNSISSLLSNKLLRWNSPQDPMHLQQKVDNTIGALVLLAAVSLGLSIPSLALDSLWLVFTAYPRRRERARAGQCTRACSRYTCDMSWDIVCAALWALVVALTCASVALHSGGPMQVQVVLALVLFALHITTAVVSGLVREEWRRSDARIDRVIELRRGACMSDALSASII